MSIQSKLKDLKDKKRYSIPAKRIKENLKPILSGSDELKQRWIWELLQNASDLGDDISTIITLTDSTVVFQHDGKPFSLDEAYNLIMPDSNKDEEDVEENIIGQFGTGFISTHILSKKIQVSGVVEDPDEDKYFEFTFNLDRSERKDKEFLIESIKTAENEFDQLKPLDNGSPTDILTSFTYDITDSYSDLNGPEIVEAGIQFFREIIPFVFAFRQELKKITFIDQRSGKNKKLVFKRKEVATEIDDLELVKTICKVNGLVQDTMIIGLIHEGDTSVAFRLRNIDTDRFEILPFPENSPKLYCAFPMVGTADFNFPIVVNSTLFTPNKERDGIELSRYDEDNRERIKEAREAFDRLVDIVEEFDWTCAYNICHLHQVDFQSADVNEWYKNQIFIPIKRKIYHGKLVELSTELEVENHRMSLSKSVIPYADRREADHEETALKIYDLGFDLIPEDLPKREHALNWFNTIDFEIFNREKLGLEELCDNLSDFNSIKKFCEDRSVEEKEAIETIKNVLLLVKEKKQDTLLENYAMIPNQEGDFQIRSDLKLDLIMHKNLKEGFAKQLKNINATLTGEDCRSELLHDQFEQIEDLLKEEAKLSFKELAISTDQALRDYEGNYQDESFLLILRDLFQWYTNCGLSEETLAGIFPFFSSNKSQLYLNTKTSEELEDAFDIEISGKSKVLAKIAKSELTNDELELIANNSVLVSSFLNWINHKQEDNPDEELGEIGEEFLYYHLCKVFGESRVKWEKKNEYDFRVLEADESTTKYYIDAKTTGKGIANTENVPFFMRTSQWRFLELDQAVDKYIVARVYKKGDVFNVRYLNMSLEDLR